MSWSDWLYAQTNTTGNIAMLRLSKFLLQFLTEEKKLQEHRVAESLWKDYQRGNRPDVPGFLKKFGFKNDEPNIVSQASCLPRQARHQQ